MSRKDRGHLPAINEGNQPKIYKNKGGKKRRRVIRGFNNPFYVPLDEDVKYFFKLDFQS